MFPPRDSYGFKHFISALCIGISNMAKTAFFRFESLGTERFLAMKMRRKTLPYSGRRRQKDVLGRGVGRQALQVAGRRRNLFADCIFTPSSLPSQSRSIVLLMNSCLIKKSVVVHGKSEAFCSCALFSPSLSFRVFEV
jgi:hypothetical protein